ncbi:carbon-nitrogen hydrolase family protein [Pseudoalteromonas sp. T1lg122]|jgi:nitrilase|uniref:carbon-nitrogen hydrolase family protein n=1 Tax=Pseudoalteromonas sp. T1lg122 TaxID=2077094 RepID=UPI000CF674BC|nr:carbon-nitrogen hydrolase family protein [Pseudoalteromonas sp. T1lg122]
MKANPHPQVVAVQMCSSMNAEQNLAFLAQTLSTLPSTRPLLVCLPESFLIFSKQSQASYQLGLQSEAYKAKLADLCKQHDIWLAAGTLPVSQQNGKYLAASFLFNNQGDVVAQYNKIHLFDVDVADTTRSYRESDATEAGKDIVVVDSPFGKIGLAVCYDLRFSGLFTAMQRQGAEIILVPSAFTTVTGAAHWHILLAARAIETQCYVVAAAQWGEHENGRHTYGHSIIISPWGETLSELASGTGFISHGLDLNRLNTIRQDMPVQSQQRFREHLL